MLSSVTVVCHGASVSFGASGGPLYELGETVYEYWHSRGGAGLFHYIKSTGDIDLDAGSANAEGATRRTMNPVSVCGASSRTLLRLEQG